MSPKTISSADAELFIYKLVKESIPVVAYFISKGKCTTLIRGFAESLDEGAIHVACRTEERVGFLSVPLGNGCRFVFGLARETSESAEQRDLSEAILGDSALLINLASGDHLSIFFSP